MNKEDTSKCEEHLHLSNLKHKEIPKGELHKDSLDKIEGPQHVKSSSDKVEMGIESHEVIPK
jgi:hypothetical protein